MQYQAADKSQRRKVLGTAVATAFGVAAGLQTTELVASAESADPEIMTMTTTAGDMVFEFWPEVVYTCMYSPVSVSVSVSVFIFVGLCLWLCLRMCLFLCMCLCLPGYVCHYVCTFVCVGVCSSVGVGVGVGLWVGVGVRVRVVCVHVGV